MKKLRTRHVANTCELSGLSWKYRTDATDYINTLDSSRKLLLVWTTRFWNENFCECATREKHVKLVEKWSESRNRQSTILTAANVRTNRRTGPRRSRPSPTGHTSEPPAGARLPGDSAQTRHFYKTRVQVWKLQNTDTYKNLLKTTENEQESN